MVGATAGSNVWVVRGTRARRWLRSWRELQTATRFRKLPRCLRSLYNSSLPSFSSRLRVGRLPLLTVSQSSRDAANPLLPGLASERRTRTWTPGPDPARDGRRTVVERNGRVKNMATLDWSQCPAVESIPGKVSGAWVFKDTRMPVSAVFENLESGATINEIMEWFDVTREQIVAVLEFAARSLDPPNLLTPESRSVTPVDAHSV